MGLAQKAPVIVGSIYVVAEAVVWVDLKAAHTTFFPHLYIQPRISVNHPRVQKALG